MPEADKKIQAIVNPSDEIIGYYPWHWKLLLFLMALMLPALMLASFFTGAFALNIKSTTDFFLVFLLGLAMFLVELLFFYNAISSWRYSIRIRSENVTIRQFSIYGIEIKKFTLNDVVSVKVYSYKGFVSTIIKLNNGEDYAFDEQIKNFAVLVQTLRKYCDIKIGNNLWRKLGYDEKGNLLGKAR